MRHLLRIVTLVGMALFQMGMGKAVIALRPRAVRVVLYHACQEEEDDLIRGLSSNVRPGRFAEQMEYLRTHYDVRDVLQLHETPSLSPVAAITFDDGYHSVLTGAAPALAAHALPYTVFLVTDVIDHSNFVWVNELNLLLRRYPVVALPLVAKATGLPVDAPTEAFIDAARAMLAPERIARLMRDIRRASGVDPAQLARELAPYLSWDEIRQLRHAGARFGNHTHSHPSLPRLTGDEAQREIVAAHETIVSELGECHAMAYPFGDVSPEARATADQLGYQCLLEVGGPQHPYRHDSVARVPAPDGGAAALFAALEVVEPLKAWVRGLRPGQGRAANA